MTATTTARLTKAGPPIPAMGTFPIAANTLILKGSLVVQNASGYAVPPTDGDGFPAIGIAAATYDNRTTAESGGAAGALDCEVKYGVHGLNSTGTTPKTGETVYVVDNQTIAVSSNGDTRGVAGVVSEVRGTQTYVLLNPALRPHNVAANVDDLDADATSASHVVRVPLNSFRVYSTGGALVPFSDGVSDGFDPTAESMGYKFNVASTAAIAASFALPNDLDDAANIVVHVLGFRVGALDTTAALTVAAFFRTVGAAFSADVNAGGATSAFGAATTVVSEATLTIAAADVPAAPASLLLTLVPTAALDADDLVVLEVWISYTRKLLA